MTPSRRSLARLVSAAALAAFTLVVLALPAGAAASWDRLRGNGNKTTVVRELPPFEVIRLDGSLDLEVTVGPAQAVSTTIDENLQAELVLRVEGKRLVIDTKRSLSWSGAGKVQIALPALAALELDGSGDARVEGGSGEPRVAIRGSGEVDWTGASLDAVDVSVRGSGEVRLSGKAERVKLAISGSGSVDLSRLPARDADVQVSGSGDVILKLAGGKLRADVSGSGDITWSGEASVERADVSGSGSIAHR